MGVGSLASAYSCTCIHCKGVRTSTFHSQVDKYLKVVFSQVLIDTQVHTIEYICTCKYVLICECTCTKLIQVCSFQLFKARLRLAMKSPDSHIGCLAFFIWGDSFDSSASRPSFFRPSLSPKNVEASRKKMWLERSWESNPRCLHH